VTFEDVTALVARSRPGPLGSGMVDDFINRKHGLAEVEYPHPDLESILKTTYGVMVYQEQVMQVAQKLANYSLGEEIWAENQLPAALRARRNAH